MQKLKLGGQNVQSATRIQENKIYPPISSYQEARIKWASTMKLK